MLTTVVASKSDEKLCSIATEVLRNSMEIGLDEISIITNKSDNEASVALSCDLLANVLGSVRCVVYMLSVSVNEFFSEDSPWQIYINNINKVISYVNYHATAIILFIEKRKSSAVITVALIVSNRTYQLVGTLFSL